MSKFTGLAQRLFLGTKADAGHTPASAPEDDKTTEATTQAAAEAAAPSDAQGLDGGDTVAASTADPAPAETEPAASENGNRNAPTDGEVLAFNAGVAAATERFQKIIGSEQAQGRETLAQSLAADPSINVEQALTILSAAEKKSASGGLSAVMDASNDTTVSNDGGNASKTPGDRMAAAMKAVGTL